MQRREAPSEEDRQAPEHRRAFDLRQTHRLDLITRDLARRPAVELAQIVVGLPDGTTEIASSAGLESWPMTCAVSAPLRLRDGRTGELVVGLSGPEPSPDADVRWLVDSFARFASISIEEGESLAAGMFAAIRTDQLTGCASYAAVLEDLANEIERSSRDGQPLSCCFVDLDGYDLVDGRFGRPRENDVLPAVGAALRGTVRANDIVGRYGGDEFVIVLPSTSLAQARAMAERARSVIRGLSVGGRRVTLDASVGVAQWIPDTGADRLLGDADRALAQAKAAGGARVVRADSGRFEREREGPSPPPARDPEVVSLSLPGGVQAPAGARAVVDSLPCALPSQERYDLRLGISELVTNSVVHSRSRDALIDLQITLGPRSIRCEVSGPEPGFAHQPSENLGLVVVDRLATRWGIRRRGRTAWFELARTA